MQQAQHSTAAIMMGRRVENGGEGRVRSRAIGGWMMSDMSRYLSSSVFGVEADMLNRARARLYRLALDKVMKLVKNKVGLGKVCQVE